MKTNHFFNQTNPLRYSVCNVKTWKIVSDFFSHLLLCILSWIYVCSRLVVIYEYLSNEKNETLWEASLCPCFLTLATNWLPTKTGPGPVSDNSEIPVRRGIRNLQMLQCLWVCVSACLELAGITSSELLIILIFKHDLNDLITGML